jgi:hypothetical protein
LKYEASEFDLSVLQKYGNLCALQTSTLREDHRKMWDKTDFEFEMNRLVSDIESLQRWQEEARDEDLRTGLEVIRLASLRLQEKMTERLEIDSFPPPSLEDESFIPTTPFSQFQGMMFLSGPEALPQAMNEQDCARCGEPIAFLSFLTKDVEENEEGWCHKNCSGALRQQWHNPSEN